MTFDKQNQTGSSRSHPSAENSGSEPAAGFTAGPWKVDPGSDEIIGGDGSIVAVTWGVPSRGPDVEAANARLIAAAPDLLEACQRAVWRLQEVERNTFHGAKWADIQAVIAKALGQSEDPS